MIKGVLLKNWEVERKL